MKRLVCAAAMAVGLMAAFAADDPSDGWAAKFYKGLEAAGDVTFEPQGYYGKRNAIVLKWSDGMPKFGAAKRYVRVKGSADWTVTAQASVDEGGKAGAAIEFFDKEGRSLALLEGATQSPRDWAPLSWTFSAPARTESAEVHLLSLDKAPVRFARVKVTAVKTADREVVPLWLKVLPVEWNHDWNGGTMRMRSFSDAPIPFTVLLRGEMRELKAPALVVEFPAELKIRDVYCPDTRHYGHVTPVSDETVTRGGRSLRRLRFEKLSLFDAPIAMRTFHTDGGSGLSFVFEPADGKTSQAYPVVCRTYDGEKLGEERAFDLEFAPLPVGLKQARGFSAMGWNTADRRISDDGTLLDSLKAYEAAGIRMFRLDRNQMETLPRNAEIRKILATRPKPYVFAARLGDMWHLPILQLTKKELAAMGGNLSKTSDKAGRRADKICPQFFTADPALRRQLDKAVASWLSIQQVQDGDIVSMDMEPWQSDTYCFCDRCLKAFAEFARLDHVPTMDEARGMRDAWAEFRVRHSAKSVEIIREAVMKYNPKLKLFDYDYVLDYGNPDARAQFIRRCAKDTLMNEQWLDGHLCSYYHKIDRVAFDSMKNNVRHLKKTYIPMAGLSGYASWVRKGEVLNPRQIRQFALAAFVNGCPAYAFYSGNCFDGEVLLSMMDAQDIAARYEDLPWGKTDGKTVPTSASELFVFASTVRPDGSEVLALFNYEPERAITVDVAGASHELQPYETKFIEIGKGK